ncbi:hypothetical protein LCGC14_2839490, partial [marine sediment metagenome]
MSQSTLTYERFITESTNMLIEGKTIRGVSVFCEKEAWLNIKNLIEEVNKTRVRWFIEFIETHQKDFFILNFRDIKELEADLNFFIKVISDDPYYIFYVFSYVIQDDFKKFKSLIKNIRNVWLAWIGSRFMENFTDFMEKKWITTDNPAVIFEDNTVGRLKKELWDASETEIEKILQEYDIPSPSELGKAGCYIQNTPRNKCIEKRRKNDILFLPIGCTENHGIHANSGLDTFMVTQILEGVRRYTAKQGREVNLAFTPLNYGGHPYHHMGMPGTVIMPKEVVEETLIYTMLGLWNDGYRKIIMINNHGHLWMLESAIQEFMKRFQLPGIFQVLDWHRGVREFFVPRKSADSLETNFIHADESET